MVDARTGEILSTKSLAKAKTAKVCDDQRKALPEAGEMAGSCASEMAWELVNIINPWYDLEEFEFDKVNADEYKKDADNACKLAEGNDLPRAFATFKRLYETDSYNPQLMYNLGILYEVTGDFNKAKEMFDAAASLKDAKDYRSARDRIARRVALVPFYANLDMAIEPLDFETEAADPGLTAQRVKVRGKTEDRIEVHQEPSETSPVVAKVPGEVMLEVVSQPTLFTPQLTKKG